MHGFGGQLSDLRKIFSEQRCRTGKLHRVGTFLGEPERYGWHGLGPRETPIRALRGVVWVVRHYRVSKGSNSGRDGRGNGILGVLRIIGVLSPSGCPCMHSTSGQPYQWTTLFREC